MTDARWIEHLRCPRCGKTGQAELVEVSQFNNRFEIVPVGFKVITEQYGSNLYCETCNVPVVPYWQPLRCHATTARQRAAVTRSASGLMSQQR